VDQGRREPRRWKDPVSLGRLSRVVPLCLLVLVSCSSRPGPPEITTVVFDGHRQSITAGVTCTTLPDGNLLVLVDDGKHDTLRVLLARKYQLVVESIGLRVGDARGFTDNSGEVWATKVDDLYKISGRMPPNAGEAAAHQFEIETRCVREDRAAQQNPGIADNGP
jgi:Mycobacterium 19 kDa lipoprotein antigen